MQGMTGRGGDKAGKEITVTAFQSGFAALCWLLFMPLLCCRPAAGLDPSHYSVPVEELTPAAFSDESARYLLTSSDENFSLPDTPFQKVLEKKTPAGGRSVVLQTGRIPGSSPAPGPQYTADTLLLNLRSPEIRELRNRFPGSGDRIPRVEGFVDRHINRKVIGIPMIPAREIYRNRSGDCTEHTVLAVAILRSLGVPARAVAGMVLVREFEGAHNVFVFHMWAEAYQGGRWHLVDATSPGEKHPGRYIAFCYHHLKTPMPLNYLKASASIKNLRVVYLRK